MFFEWLLDYRIIIQPKIATSLIFTKKVSHLGVRRLLYAHFIVHIKILPDIVSEEIPAFVNRHPENYGATPTLPLCGGRMPVAANPHHG